MAGPGHAFFWSGYKKAARKLAPAAGMVNPIETPLGTGQVSAPTIGQFSPFGGSGEAGASRQERGSTEDMTLLEQAAQALTVGSIAPVPDPTSPLAEAERRRRRAMRLGG